MAYNKYNTAECDCSYCTRARGYFAPFKKAQITPPRDFLGLGDIEPPIYSPYRESDLREKPPEDDTFVGGEEQREPTQTDCEIADALGYTIKDSGKRQEFQGGMVRDTTEGKIDYSLIIDGPMFKRWAEHLTKGAKKYSKRNWMKGEGKEVLERAKESAFRHFVQWFTGESDEDHAAAVFFNINLAEYLKETNVKSKLLQKD